MKTSLEDIRKVIDAFVKDIEEFHNDVAFFPLEGRCAFLKKEFAKRFDIDIYADVDFIFNFDEDMPSFSGAVIRLPFHGHTLSIDTIDRRCKYLDWDVPLDEYLAYNTNVLFSFFRDISAVG